MRPKGLTCLSPKWWAMVDYTFREANRLRLQVNFMNSPSWSGSSGPWVKPEQAMQIVVSSESQVAGPVQGKLPLPHPPVITVPNDRDGKPREIVRFYRDIAVLAFPTPAVEKTPFSQCVAVISTSDGKTVAKPEDLLDHNPDTFLELPPAAKPSLQFELKEPLTVRGLTLKLFRPNTAIRKIEVQASQDGKAWSKVCNFPPEKHRLGVISRNANPYTERATSGSIPVRARFLRIVFDFGGGTNNTVTVGDVEFHCGVRITDLASKAGYIRNASSPFDPQDIPLESGMAIGPKEVVDLTDHLKADGTLDWNVPAGHWTILRFGRTIINSTGQEAPLAARGLKATELSRDASEATWNHGQLKKLIDTAGPLVRQNAHHRPHRQLRRRLPELDPKPSGRIHQAPGIRSLPFFPVLTGRIVQSVAVSERFLWDYRRTLVDLFNDNWYGYFRDYCHRYGLLTTVECYGDGNFDWQEAGARADIPSSEFWTVEDFGSRNHMGIRCPASAAHVWGKSIVNAEAFTGQPYASKMLGHPYRLKQIGDYAWSLGVNRYVFHGYPCQPWQNVEPGMMFGPWGTQIGRTITWWASMGQDWIRYITRAQFLLQRGRPSADVCVFEGETDTPGSGAFFVEESATGHSHRLRFRLLRPRGAAYADVGPRRPDRPSRRRELPLLAAQIALQQDRDHDPRGAQETSRAGGGRSHADRCPARVFPKPVGLSRLRCESQSPGRRAVGRLRRRERQRASIRQGEGHSRKTFRGNRRGRTACSRFRICLRESQVHAALDPSPRQGRGDLFRGQRQAVSRRRRLANFASLVDSLSSGIPTPGGSWCALLSSPTGKPRRFPIHFDAKGSLFVVFRKPAMADPVVVVHAPAVKRAELAIVKAQLHTYHGEFDMTKKLRALAANGAVDVDVAQNIGGNYTRRDTMSVDYTVDGVPASELYYGFEWAHIPVTDAFDSNIPCQVVQTAQGPAALMATPGDYSFSFASGKTKSFHVNVPQPLAIAGPWEVRFQPQRSARRKSPSTSSFPGPSMPIRA